MIPVIIFHIGNQQYLHDCVNVSSRYGNEIHLLNDNPNNFKNIENVIVDNYLQYASYADKFKSLYKHFSTNSVQLEFICIIRWFCICKYMEEKNIQKAFICDSDILIFDNISHVVDTYLHNDMYLCSSGSKNVSGSQSVFTLSKLQEFINFTMTFYQTQISNMEKWKLTYDEPGGICDMTLLYYFAHNTSEFVGLRLPGFPYYENDLTVIFENDFTIDLHQGVSGNHLHPDDYEMIDGHKNMKMIDGTPFCFNKRLGKDIRFVLLHFQGRNKKFMSNYAK